MDPRAKARRSRGGRRLLALSGALVVLVASAAAWWLGDGATPRERGGAHALAGVGEVGLPPSGAAPQTEPLLGALTADGASTPVDLVPGEVVAAPGTEELAPVPGLVTGRVLDEQGAPLAGARVVWVPDSDTAAVEGFGATTVKTLATDVHWPRKVAPLDSYPFALTDAEGRFELRRDWIHPRWWPMGDEHGLASPRLLEHRRYISFDLLVLAEGYAPARQDCVAFGSWEDGTHDAGVCTLERAGALEGRVVDEDGRPLAGVDVSLGQLRAVEWACNDRGRGRVTGCGGYDSPSDVERAWRRSMDRLVTARTDADGRYHIRDVPHGAGRSHVLRAAVRGRLPAERGGVVVSPGGVLRLPELVLHRGGELAGRVLDGEGRPLADATVRLGVAELVGEGLGIHHRLAAVKDGVVDASTESSMRASEAAATLVTRTDEDGRWQLGGLAAERHDVYVEARGHEPTWLPRVVNGRRDLEHRLDPAHPLELELVDERGEPLAFERLELAHAPHPTWKLQHRLEEHDLSVDEVPTRRDARPWAVSRDGSVWRFPAVCSCPRQLELEGGEVGRRRLELPGWSPADAAGPRRIVVPRTAVVRLAGARGLHGPLAAYRSWVRPVGTPPAGWPHRSSVYLTDREGGGRGVELPPGRYELSVSAQEHERRVLPLELEAGQVLELEAVPLAEGARVEIFVMGPAGRSVAGVFVDVWSVPPPGPDGEAPSPRRVARKTTDEAGRVHALSNRSGPHVVKVRFASGGPVLVEQPVELEPGDQQTLGLQVPAAGVVTGEVRDAAGGTVGGTVVVTPDDSRSFTVKVVQGRYEVTAPLGSSGAVRLVTNVGLSEPQPYRLDGAGPCRVPLALEERPVEVRVTDAVTGEPLRASLRLNAFGVPTPSQRTTDEQGHTTFRSVPRGARLHATHGEYLSHTVDADVLDRAVAAGVPVELRLARKARLVGRVLSPSGDAHLAWDEVLVYRDAGNGRMYRVGRGEVNVGRYEVTVGEAGPYLVLLVEGRSRWSNSWVSAVARERARWEVTLGHAEERTLDLHVPDPDDR